MATKILPVDLEAGLGRDDPGSLERLRQLEEWLLDLHAELDRLAAVLKTARGAES